MNSVEAGIDKDTSSYAVIPYDSAQQWKWKQDHQPASLSEQEIKEIDFLLKEAVRKSNTAVQAYGM